jgi:ribonuclease P/MRP protein subunit POP1
MHYPQSRFGGLREYAQICFEKKGMAFPADWPGTRAGDVEEERLAAEVRRQWERRPDGKRESWGKVLTGEERGEIGDPFGCDWSLLFNKKNGETHTEELAKEAAGENIVGESAEETIETAGSMEEIRKRAQAAMGGKIGHVKTKASHFLLSPGYANQLLTRKSPLIPSADLKHALLPIRLHFLQKGNVSYRARIYRIPLSPEERQKWTNLLDQNAPKTEKKDYPVCPGETDLLGFVTSGNVSLSEGRGRAVGALSWVRVEVEEERWSYERKFQRWCIVRDVGMDIARLARWEVNE